MYQLAPTTITKEIHYMFTRASTPLHRLGTESLPSSFLPAITSLRYASSSSLAFPDPHSAMSPLSPIFRFQAIGPLPHPQLLQCGGGILGKRDIDVSLCGPNMNSAG
jgi:hypothetical protein